MGQLSVICQQKQPFRILIQPSHRKQVFSASVLNQFNDRFLPGILRSRDNACRFVQHNVFIFNIGHRCAFPEHRILIRYLEFGPGHRFLIDFCKTFTNAQFDFASAAHAHFCQIFIQSHLTATAIPKDIYSLTFRRIPSPIRENVRRHRQYTIRLEVHRILPAFHILNIL